MQRIEEFARIIDAKHALFLFDSCFSGSLFALSRAIPQDIGYKTAMPVRQFITSGSKDEQVSDHSIFRRQFIVGLEGEADTNSDGYITGTELSSYLQSSVINYSKGYQHPQYGKIRHPNLDKGDFVFSLPSTPHSTPTSATAKTKKKQLVDQSAETTTEQQEFSIDELARRFRNTDKEPLPSLSTRIKDSWSRERPITLVFLGIDGVGSSPGERNFIIDIAAEQLRESGRFTIVERHLLDKLIAELELSHSDLADPRTSLKLGKILSASLVVTGSLNRNNNDWLASLRFIDTETTSIISSVSKIIKDSGPESTASQLSSAINYKLKRKFPIQGKIKEFTHDSVTIDIGQAVGVQENMVFEILDEKGFTITQITVTKAGPNTSVAQAIQPEIQFQNGLRIREIFKQ